MAPSFQPPRDRDAWSTIRGYVYQVDLSILRWLGLQEGQHLELERGEDIDLIGRALATDDPAEWRRLEQVKHRDENLTLRNPSAIEALANAADHLQASPGLDLRFCYSTNAAVGQERPSVFRRRTPALAAWEQVRLGELNGPELTQVLTALRAFLRQAAQPAGLDDGVWLRFQQFLAQAEDEQFADFIHRFEWSTGRPAAEALGAHIQAALRERQSAADEADAEQLYQRLFLHVFKLLCQQGVKRLTRAGLHEQLAKPTLTASDRALLDRLTGRLRLLERKVEAVEVGLLSLGATVRSLAQHQNIRGALTVSDPLPDLGLPSLVQRHSLRADTVSRLTAVAQGHAWTALHGGPDTGKSQLALLVALRLGSCRAWARLHHDMLPERAGSILDRAIEAVTGCRRSRFSRGWYNAAFGQFGPGALLVLDDLPRLPGDDPLSQRLGEVVRACEATGVRLLSTSLHPAPVELRNALGSSLFHQEMAPPLSEPEAREVLAAHGAPEGFLTEDHVRCVNTLAAGHPLVLSLGAEYLQRRGWRLDGAGLEGLLRGEHVAGLAQDATARLMRALDDAQRDLLYRLTLVIGPFPTEVVRALAAVPPAVPRPQECLHHLMGAWVQRDTQERFTVSPVARAVGAGDLGPTTRAGCHVALAALITSRRMSLFEAETAVGHLVQANELGRAGVLFIILLQKVEEVGASADARSFLAMWCELPLPEGMELGLRLLIRAYQLGVLPKFGRRIDFVLQDIDRLLPAATQEHGWAIVGLAIRSVTCLAPTDPDRALRYLRRALELPEETVSPTGEALFPNSEVRLDELLWFLIVRIDTVDRLRAWLVAAASLAGDRLQRFFQLAPAKLGSLVLADRLVLTQLSRPPRQRCWQEALTGLDELAAWAHGRGLRLLWACAIRSKLYAFGDMGQVGEARTTGREALREAAGDPTAQFLIAGALARQHIRKQEFDLARPLLELALGQTVTDYPHERMLFLLTASHSYGVEDAEAGVLYAQQAVELARAEESIPALEAARACAELGVAQFLQAGPAAGPATAFEAWSEAAERLFAAKEEDDQWKDAFVLFAHMTGYLTLLAGTGSPPTQARDGSAWGPPARGLFMLNVPERPDYYRPGGDSAVMWLLAQYADAVGNDRRAIRWLARASEAAGDRVTVMQTTIGRDLVPTLLLGNRYEDAIDQGLKGAQALQAFLIAQNAGLPLDQETDLAPLLEGMTPEQRRAAERDTMPLSVVPAMLRVCAVALGDEDTAFRAGHALASVFRQMSESSQDRQLWEGAAAVFDNVCRAGSTALQLIEQSTGFDGEGRTALRVLCHLGAALHGTVEEAFPAQACVMEVLFSWMPPGRGAHRRLLLPYVEHFWADRLARQRFSFRAPAAVENAVSEARRVPEAGRVRAILRAVRIGVRVRLPEETSAWLNSP